MVTSRTIKRKCPRLISAKVGQNVVNGWKESARSASSELQNNGLEQSGTYSVTVSRRKASLAQRVDSENVTRRSRRSNSSWVEENMVTGLRKSPRLGNLELQSIGFADFGTYSVTDSGRSVSLRPTQKGGYEKVKRSDRKNNSRVGKNVLTTSRKSARLTKFQSKGLEQLGASNETDSRKCVPSRLTHKGDSAKVMRSHRLDTAIIEEKVVAGMKKSARSMNAEVEINGTKDLEKGTPILSMVKGRGEKKKRTVVGEFEETGVKRRDPFEKLGVEGDIKHDKSVFEEVPLRKNHGLPFGSSSSPKRWSPDQEMALERAYLIVKPSPNFWKEVAQMVPHKSAQECFDKVNSTFLTPPPPRSRTKRKILSPLDHFQLSEDKLLEPFHPSGKKPKSSKQKALLAQRTVRHVLKKHERVDQENEADLFSVLEAMNPKDQTFPLMEVSATPDCILKPCNSLQKYHEKSTLPKVENPNVSPEILKQVKNLAMHEKYIDQLHCREAKRKTEFSRKKGYVSSSERTKESCLQKAEVVRAARTALVSDARDVLKQFQQLQTDSADNYDGSDDDGDVDEDEDIPE